MAQIVNSKIARSAIEHALDLLRVSAGIERDVARLLGDLEAELAAALARHDLSASKERRLRALLLDARREIDASYTRIQSLMTREMVELAGIESKIIAGIMNDAIGLEVIKSATSRKAWSALMSNLMIQAAPSKDWWSRQAGSTAFRFAQEMRKGIIAGETNAELISRVRDGILDVSRRQAEALVRSSVQTVSNAARMETFRANSDVVKEVQQISTLDTRTSEVCIAYSGKTWDLDGNPTRGHDLPFNDGPPRHWNCRSALIPVTVTWREMGIGIDEMPPGRRAMINGQVASNTSFEEWFESMPKTKQDEILGKGKADLWRRKKITFSDLVDRRGDPMSLRDLQRKRGV